MILFPQCDHLFPGGVLLGRASGTLRCGLKERPIRVLAELMAQNAEAAVAVPEALGDLARRHVVDEESAKRFVLTVGRVGWSQEDLGERCYLSS